MICWSEIPAFLYPLLVSHNYSIYNTHIHFLMFSMRIEDPERLSEMCKVSQLINREERPDSNCLTIIFIAAILKSQQLAFITIF